ncbi:MAG: hypothetical protein V4649_09935 [Bacteroidota bacterium]
MTEPVAEIVDVTESEASWLMTIYQLRRKDLFFKGCLRCLFSSIMYVVIGYGIVSFLHDLVFYESKWFTGNAFIRRLPWLAISGAIASFVVVAAVYFRSVLPFYHDALSGKKIRQPYIVTQKEYFYITGQYFVRLNNGLDKRYEMNQQTYNSCEVGKITFVHQAMASRYVFTENDHVVTSFFKIKRGSRFDYKV